MNISQGIMVLKDTISHGLFELKNGIGIFAGHCFRVLKSGKNETVNYLQNPLIAKISIVAVCLIGLRLSEIANRYVTNAISFKYRNYRIPAAGAAVIATYFGTLACYVKLVKIPVSTQFITGVSLFLLLTQSFTAAKVAIDS